MISSNLILVAKGIKAVPLIVAIVCAAIAGIAFFIGFKKGFRRISWGCFTCLVATGGFALANGLLIKKKIVLNINLKGFLEARVLTTFLIAIACITLVLVLYGLCTWLLRPSYKIINKNPIVGEKCGVKVENDDDKHAPQYVRWRNAGSPTLFGRLIGGVINAVNCLGVLAIILAAVVIFIKATGFQEAALAPAMSVKAARLFLEYSLKYAVDFVIISCIVLMAFKGYKNGLVGSIRFLVVSFGGLILGSLAFMLPFMSGVELTSKLVERCTTLLGGIPEQFRVIAGKLLAGMLLFAIFMAVLAVINFGLNKLNYIVIRLKPIRTFDGVLACFLYLLLGVLICIAIWCVLYAMEYCGLLEVSKAFSEESSLAGSLMKLGEKLAKPLVEKYVVQ